MAVVKNNGSRLRSKEDEERLARQKAANPTNIQRAKELAKQYSNPHNFSNTNTVTKTEYNNKWWSGTKPTARETVARMYEVSGGDKAKFQELEAQYNSEINNRGSVIYNPYATVSNYKAVQGLQNLGVKVPETITADWLDGMWSQYGQYARETTSSYGPSAPTNSSSVENDIAYWVDTLRADEENTSLAETQLQTMADEVKYWADLGYSDNAIIKKVQDGFDSKYNVLSKMDEQRLLGDAVRLNRAVNYNGDDTIYGMIWAARNEGTGDYFTDAVKYTLGQGNKYKSDPYSEAARDPSNYEGYHPYILGSTLHKQNQNYGVTSIDQQWLDDNRWMLNDSSKKDDYIKYQDAYEFTQEAETELAALDSWLTTELEKVGDSESARDALVATLKAHIEDGDEITYKYVDDEGKTKIATIKLTNLSKMEDARKDGGASNIAYAIDFTLPRYIDKIDEAYEQNVATAKEAADKAAEEEANKQNIFQKVGGAIDTALTAAGEWYAEGREDNQYRKAAQSGGRKGDFGADVQSVYDARVGAETADEVFANFLKSEFGVEFGGVLTDKEREIVEKAISTNEEGTKRDYTDEGRAEAEKAAADMYGIAQAIASQPERLKSKEDAYVNSAAYSTIVGANKQKEEEADLYARGMIDGELTAQAHIEGAEGSSGAMPEIDYKYRLPETNFDNYAWTAMLDGSADWNGDLFEKALAVSTDPGAVMTELADGIADQMKGGEGNAISQSWMKKFGGMTRNTEAKHSLSPQANYYASQSDSRSIYGPEIKNAILLNEEALNKGAISKQEYIANLINLSSTAEIVQSAAGGKKVKAKLSAEVLASGDGSLGKELESFEAYCNEKIAAVDKQEAEELEAAKNNIVAIRDAAIAGTMDETQSMVNGVIMSSDVSAVSNKDKTYKKYSKYLEAAAPGEYSYADLQMQEGDSNSPANTIGGYDTVYNRGVSAIAMNVLNRDMHYAAALGMSLNEYYDAYPEYSKSPEQMLEEAKEEFNSKWEEFGNDPEALQAVSELFGVGTKQSTSDEESTVEYSESVPIFEGGLTWFDIFREATSKYANDFDMNLAKTVHFFRFDLGDEREKTSKLISKYGNDPAALRTAWDKVLLDEKIPDNVKSEVQTKLDTVADIYKMGDPDELVSDLDIAEYQTVGKYYDDVIAANGNEFEKFVYNAISAAENMITMMATSQVGSMYGVSSYATSMASMFTSEYANAYDYTQQTGDANAAFLWSTAALAVTSKIEQWQMDKYLTPNASKWDDAISRAKYQVGKKGVFKTMFDPDGLKTMLKGVLAAGGKSAVNAGGEFAEEFSQGLVDSAAKHRALKDKAILTKEDFKQATIEGVYSGVLGFAAGDFAGDVGVDMNDYVSTEIESAEAILDDAADGNAINEAIEFESTVAAIQESGEQLAQLQESAEYKAVAQAEEAVTAAEQEVAEATAEYEAQTEQQQQRANELAELDGQIANRMEYTEDMKAQMEAAAAALEELNNKVAESQKRKAEAETKLESARTDYAAKQETVQNMYRQIMDTAKAKAEQEIADAYYNGNTDEQKAASEEYRKACKELQEANKELAKANFENARSAHRGRMLIAVDQLKARVAEARAKVQEAFQNAPESKEATGRKQELEAAESEVQKAVEKVKQAEAQAKENAAESIENLDEIDADEQQRRNDASDRVLEKKQLALISAQAKLEAIKAKQKLESIKENVNKRLNSADSNVRAEAVAEWQAAQQEANAAVQEAQDAEALYNETDTQKQLREATENMKQYTNEQLLFEDVDGHVDAVKAYNRLLLAKAEAKAEKALMNANNTKIGTEEHTKAVAEYNQATEELEDELGRQMGTDGDEIRAWKSVAGSWGDHRTPGKTGETTVADQNPIEILTNLTNSIRVGYNPGGDMSANGKRVPKAVQGFYQTKAESITTRSSEAGNLVTGLHEFGHAAHARLPELKANQQLIAGLDPKIKEAYSASEIDGEAIAEFVVDYIYSRDEAIRQAGEDFVTQFEQMLQNDKTLNNAIIRASEQVALWNNASVESKMDAMVKDSLDPNRGKIGNGFKQFLRGFETAVFDLTAPANLVSRDFRQKALYSMHASRRADVALTRFLIDPQGRNIGKSLAQRFYEAGVTADDMQEVVRFALARHALDRRAEDKDVFSPEEFSTEDLKGIVDNAPENIKAGANAITSFWNDFMDAWWVNTGMIDKKSVDNMRNKYKNYVPTFRVMGENFSQYGGKSSRFQIKGATKGGSSLEVINPIASIVNMTQQMVSTVTQNELMRAFHSEYRKGGLGDIADDVSQKYRVVKTNTTNLENILNDIKQTNAVDPALMDDAFAAAIALQERWYGTGQNNDPNVVSGIDERGVPFFYEIKDTGLYNMLSGNANRSSDMGSVWGAIRKFKNAFTKLTTGSNPLFAIKNMQRDIQASVNTGTYALTYADGMVRWIGALKGVLTNEALFQEWVAMGGGEHGRINTSLNEKDAGELTKELGKELFRGKVTRKGDFKTKSTALEKISNILTLEQINNAVEMASRYVEYKYGKHDLTTAEGKMEAFMASQDVTTNFGTHGANQVIKILNQIVPFMNAALQGLNKDINIVKDVFSSDPNVRNKAAAKAGKIAMNTMLTAALQYALLRLFKGKDDDEDYAILSQEMRIGNLIIPIPKGAMESLGNFTGFDKPYIRIPIAQGVLARSVYAAGLDLMANVADYSPMEVEFWAAAKSIIKDAVPDGTIFQGLIDTMNNRTWWGGQIESDYQIDNYSEGNRYNKDTPGAVIWLARKIGTSPAKLEYLLNQYGGFAGKVVMPFISPDKATGEWSIGSAGRNVFNKILGNYTIDPVGTNEYQSKYTAAKDVINHIVGDSKNGMPVNEIAYSADPVAAVIAAKELKTAFAAIDERISNKWSDYNYIGSTYEDIGDRSREQRAIRKEINEEMDYALALYEEFKMNYIDCDTLAQEISGFLPGGLERRPIE